MKRIEYEGEAVMRRLDAKERAHAETKAAVRAMIREHKDGSAIAEALLLIFDELYELRSDLAWRRYQNGGK